MAFRRRPRFNPRFSRRLPSARAARGVISARFNEGTFATYDAVLQTWFHPVAFAPIIELADYSEISNEIIDPAYGTPVKKDRIRLTRITGDITFTLINSYAPFNGQIIFGTIGWYLCKFSFRAIENAIALGGFALNPYDPLDADAANLIWHKIIHNRMTSVNGFNGAVGVSQTALTPQPSRSFRINQTLRTSLETDEEFYLVYTCASTNESTEEPPLLSMVADMRVHIIE